MRKLQVLIGLAIAAIGAVVAWCGLAVSADFADLGAAAWSAGDDGSSAGLVVILAGVLEIALGIVVTSLPARPRR